MTKQLEIRKPGLEVWRWVSFGSGCVIFNQLVTLFVRKNLPASILVNEGVIFGYVRHPLAMTAIVIIGFVLIGRVVTTNPQSHWTRWGVTLVLAGAISNLIDRVILGGVVDYFSFFGWSTFNLADAEIVIGALFLAWPEKIIRRTSD